MSYATATTGGELNWTTASTSCNVTQPVGSPTFWFYRTVVEVYIVSALCVAGVIGNLLSMIVLRRDRDRPNATNWLLQALAVVDSIYLVASVLIQPLKTINDIGDLDGPRAALRRVFPYVEPHAWAVASIAQTAAVWLVLLVTVDRYVAVCQPLQVCFIVHTPCLKKTVQNCFCQNLVKFPPILIIFGRNVAKRLKLCEVHSFSTSPISRHHTSVLNADVPNCYATQRCNKLCNKLSNGLISTQ